MDLVYRFMKKRDIVHGVPPFFVPQMRFVKAGIAFSKVNDQIDAYLLEEFIDSDSSDTWFVKYLNNSSAKPHKFHHEEKSLRAIFLSFAQHVQFLETKGLAFLSDLQGMHMVNWFLNGTKFCFFDFQVDACFLLIHKLLPTRNFAF